MSERRMSDVHREDVETVRAALLASAPSPSHRFESQYPTFDFCRACGGKEDDPRHAPSPSLAASGTRKSAAEPLVPDDQLGYLHDGQWFTIERWEHRAAAEGSEPLDRDLLRAYVEQLQCDVNVLAAYANQTSEGTPNKPHKDCNCVNCEPMPL